ncbi:uncharacterized protein [Rutidosis leptorrhynchoides]|uniref:uncharacterized protein n=1 Tax=Rutidosis leptorrhynchoides TaxID=125765 RepID=UPI003A993419
MGLTSLQVCMDSSAWFQGTIQDQETEMDSSSPSGITDPMLACSPPLMERRLRPQLDQALKCPRCDSTHTKFCYYNNYSLTQPRYFCKTCRRYWTKGGTLRNIPVGGGCKKNKKVSSSSKKPTSTTLTGNNSNNNNNNNNDNNSNSNIQHHHQNLNLINPNHNYNHNYPMIMNSSDLQLSYPDTAMQFPRSNLFGIGNSSNINSHSFMFDNLNSNATRAIEFMENGVGIMGNGGYGSEMGGVNLIGQNYHGGSNLCSPFGGMTLDSINNPFTERRLIAYNHDQVNDDHAINLIDVKPKILSLEWQDENGTNSGGGSGGGGSFMTGVASWGSIMNGYGSATNTLA